MNKNSIDNKQCHLGADQKIERFMQLDFRRTSRCEYMLRGTTGQFLVAPPTIDEN